jgi:predicted Rdx family selenoprotein
VSLAHQLQRQGHTASAVEGARSQFDVLVDGELVFSKQQEQRFPELDEITTRLG